MKIVTVQTFSFEGDEYVAGHVYEVSEPKAAQLYHNFGLWVRGVSIAAEATPVSVQVTAAPVKRGRKPRKR